MIEQTVLVRAQLLCLILAVSVSGCASEPGGRSGDTNTDSAARELRTPFEVESATPDSGSIPETTQPVAADTTTTSAPTARAFNGRPVPRVVRGPEEAAVLFIQTEADLRAAEAQPEGYANLGHTEQLIIRQLTRNESWIEPFRASLPDDILAIADLHLTARSELSLLHAGGAPPLENIPAWRIIEPEPLDVLVAHYQAAEQETGIDWEILAGINLIETGMGRIDGLSTAGAQGPMQFLPTTWDEVSQGGDINSAEDAIHGAARYLVQRGGLSDISAGLYGYNNSDHYVNAVLAYADLLRLDERSLRGFYNWEIYVGTKVGTLWLPVGFLAAGPLPAIDYLAENPWALTLG